MRWMCLVSCLLLGCVDAESHGTSDTTGAAASSSSADQDRAQPSPSSSAKASRRGIADVLAAIPEDPPPPKIIRSTHYFVSNEHKPERFRQQVENLGGVFIGVGAEQNYLLAGWAKPKALLLVDFDQWVVDVHILHGMFMREAKDPAAFVHQWSLDQREHALALIEKKTSDPAERQRLLDGFAIMRPGVYAQLNNLRIKYDSGKIPTVLTDQAQYDHVAELFRSGHARALRGDFTGSTTLKGIAAAARELELPVRTIYVSNVEDYFDYDTGLGPNLIAQPTDKRTLLLRTIPIDDISYVYVAQRMSDFRAWLDAGAKRRANILAKGRMHKLPNGMFLSGPEP